MDWKDEEVKAGQMTAREQSMWLPEAVVRAIMTRAVELAAARGGTMTAEQISVAMKELRDTAYNAPWSEDIREEDATRLDAIEQHISALGARNAVLEAERAHLKGIIAYVEECDGGPHLLKEAKALAEDRKDDVREERDELRAEVERLTARLEKHENPRCQREECARERARVDTLKAENAACRERLEKRTQEIKDERDGLRERLSAAEESTRELVRRAQQAEAQAERNAKNAAMWVGRVEAAAEELADVGAGEVGRLDIVSRVRMLKAHCATLSAAGQVLSAHVDKHVEGVAAAHACAHRPLPGWRCTQAVGHAMPHTVVPYFPCSPTCTHDDAATPGHPERVKERSEAVASVTSPESLTAGYIRLNDTATLMGARDEAPTHPEEIARREGFNEGAEAMRVVCWKAVQACLQEHGYGGDMLKERLKSAIEGAVP